MSLVRRALATALVLVAALPLAACGPAAPAWEASGARAAARPAGAARVATLDASRVQGDADLLARLGAAFGAPAYFGRNWDALDEVLRDLEWLGAPSAGGHLLLVEGAKALWASHGPSAGR